MAPDRENSTTITPKKCLVHATTVALGNRAVMITGPSGSGKSALALQLMAYGLVLVADDQTCLNRATEGHILTTSPTQIRGIIEARGVGLLAADTTNRAILALVIDMGVVEQARLPDHKVAIYLQQEIPLLHKVESCHFPAAVFQYLKGGRTA